MALLELIFRSFWTFIGFTILFYILFHTIMISIRGYRPCDCEGLKNDLDAYKSDCEGLKNDLARCKKGCDELYKIKGRQ